MDWSRATTRRCGSATVRCAMYQLTTCNRKHQQKQTTGAAPTRQTVLCNPERTTPHSSHADSLLACIEDWLRPPRVLWGSLGVLPSMHAFSSAVDNRFPSLLVYKLMACYPSGISCRYHHTPYTIHHLLPFSLPSMPDGELGPKSSSPIPTPIKGATPKNITPKHSIANLPLAAAIPPSRTGPHLIN